MSTQIHTLQTQGAKRYAFKAQGEEAATIDIFGEIDDWWGYGVREMAYNLSQNKKKKLTINIHSPGGSVTEGIGIANLLKAHDAEVTTNGIGFVASIASVILLAGDKVQMARNAWLMIHNPWGLAMGDSEEMKRTAETLAKMEDQLAGLYLNAIESRGKESSIDELKQMMRDETWMTADEAKAKGFIDDVVDRVEVSDSTNDEKEIEGMAAMMNKFSNVPQALAAQFTNKKPEKMAKKDSKSLFAKIGELFVAAANDIEEATETQEEQIAAPAGDEQTDSTMTAEEMIEYLTREGYTVAQKEAEQQEAPSAAAVEEEAAAEMVAQLKAQVEELTKAVKRKVGTPSGGAEANNSQPKTGSAPKAAMPFFDSLANAIKAHRPG